MNQNIPLALIDRKPARSDYVKGTAAGIIAETRISNGDWTPYLPNYQPQKFKFDTNECSQLSGINCLETQCNFLRANGRFSEEALKWFKDNGYFDEATDLFDFSERFVAILSGTSIKGGTQWSFWTTTAQYGILPWKDLNYSMDLSQKFNTQQEMCADYYSPAVITEAMKAKALKALEYIQIQYQWIYYSQEVSAAPGTIAEALKQAPLQIGTPACLETWNTGSVKVCGRTSVDHATMLYKHNEDMSNTIRDHYQPMNKILSADYFILAVTQGIASPVPTTDKNWKHSFVHDLEFGDKGEEVKNLQRALVILGYLEPKYITGNFLDKTAAALLRFQLDRGVLWSFLLNFYAGHYCSARTRKALNARFSNAFSD